MHFKRTSLVASLAFMTAVGHAQYTIIGEDVTPYSVNNQGQVAGYDFTQYFMWSSGTGYQGIGGQIPGNGHGGIPRISGDGSRVGGTAINQNTGLSEMAYYDVATNTWTTVGSLGSSSDAGASAGFGMSGSGATIVGNAWIDAGHANAVRWNNGVLTDLGTAFAGSSSRADAVSDDGTVIGGYQDREDGYRSASVWINGAQILLDGPTGDPLAQVHAISGNGQYVMGGGGYALDYHAYIWNQATGITALDNPFYDMGYEMVPTATNYDGSLIIGYARDFTGLGWGSLDAGWMWSASTGVMTINDYAASLGFATGDFLTNPLGISADGRYIVGQGINESFTSVIGWQLAAPVPEPASFVALLGGLGALMVRRRNRSR